MIRLKDVFLKYPGGNVALNNATVNFEKGDLVYIVGPSGSGKTSLLKILMGMEKPSSGEYKIFGKSIASQSKKDIQINRQKIGPIFQEFRLLSGRTSLENVMISMRFLDYKNSKMKELATEALSRVGLAHKINEKVDNLSWGESQRVAIARAIVRKPSIIIADEPTGNLDVDNAINILKLLTSLRDEETLVIITTHATHLIDKGDKHKLITMDNGVLLMEDSND